MSDCLLLHPKLWRPFKVGTFHLSSFRLSRPFLWNLIFHWKDDWHWLFRLRFAGDTFSKKNQVSLKENNWGYLLLIIKFKLSSKNYKFGNLLVWETVSLRASHCLALESEIDGVVVIQLLSRVWLFATPWTEAHQASLFFTISQNLLILMSIKLVMTSNHLSPPSPPFLNLSQHKGLFQWVGSLHQVAKVVELSFSIIPSKEIKGLISLRMDWFDLLAVQITLKSLLQHHSSKASILQHSVFFIVQISHLYMTTGKTIALTIWTFVGNAF